MLSTTYSVDQLDNPKNSMSCPKANSRDVSILVGLCYAVVAMIFVMVGLGGYTRLTGSGLSMVDWRPITGFLPPMSTQEWEQVFSLYKTSPEYQLKNLGMDLDGFKNIFWLEYIHRLWGRIIGVVFFVPIVVSFLKPSLRPWTKRFFAIWILGGLQGVMGWYMVKSGLNKDPEVSPYRLCAHLLLAFATVVAIFWTALNLRTDHSKRLHFLSAFTTHRDRIGFALILATIIYGAFVAGMKAGWVYNTFPLMGGEIIPDELLFHVPWYENFFVNPVTVQFTHRVLAITTFAFMIWYAITALTSKPVAPLKQSLLFLKAAVTTQFILGISTLITQVQMDLAVAHQMTALVLLLAFVRVLFLKRYN